MADDLMMKDMENVDLLPYGERLVNKACSVWGRFGARGNLGFVYSFLVGPCGGLFLKERKRQSTDAETRELQRRCQE